MLRVRAASTRSIGKLPGLGQNHYTEEPFFAKGNVNKLFLGQPKDAVQTLKNACRHLLHTQETQFVYITFLKQWLFITVIGRL
jgi:hypothetical protein